MGGRVGEHDAQRAAFVYQYELELRDREAEGDIATLQSSVQSLLTKYEPDQLDREARAREIEDLAAV